MGGRGSKSPVVEPGEIEQPKHRIIVDLSEPDDDYLDDPYAPVNLEVLSNSFSQRMEGYYALAQDSGTLGLSYEIMFQHIDDDDDGHSRTHYNALKKYAEEQLRLEVVEGDMKGQVKGEVNHADKVLTLRQDMNDAQKVKTIAHEIAHAILHYHPDDQLRKGGARMELEAEWTAMLVLDDLGIKTYGTSETYIASWSKQGNIDLTNFSESANDVAHAYSLIKREALK